MTARLVFTVAWVVALTVMIGVGVMPGWGVLFLLPWALVGAFELNDLERREERNR